MRERERDSFTGLEILPNAFFSISPAAESSGKEVFVKVLSMGGGVMLNTAFSTIVGTQGDWFLYSNKLGPFTPGFFLLVVLETESLSAKGCKEGSLSLKNGVIVNLSV